MTEPSGGARRSSRTFDKNGELSGDARLLGRSQALFEVVDIHDGEKLDGGTEPRKERFADHCDFGGVFHVEDDDRGPFAAFREKIGCFGFQLLHGSGDDLWQRAIGDRFVTRVCRYRDPKKCTQGVPLIVVE